MLYILTCLYLYNNNEEDSKNSTGGVWGVSNKVHPMEDDRKVEPNSEERN